VRLQEADAGSVLRTIFGKVPRLPMRWNSANEVALNFDLGEKNYQGSFAHPRWFRIG
jgi:hypothetical protein